MTQVEIRTSDHQWAATHGKPGRDGRTIATVREIESRNGFITFTFDGTVPSDLARTGFAPVQWIVG